MRRTSDFDYVLPPELIAQDPLSDRTASRLLVLDRAGSGVRHARFVGSLDARATLAKYGEVPLPPYIRRPPRPEDRERYQTVYAAHDGSVAAPTAGLHFTSELLARIRAKCVAVAELDLHVGPGTFKPVQESDLANHRMDSEDFAVSEAAAAAINDRRRAGGHVMIIPGAGQ